MPKHILIIGPVTFPSPVYICNQTSFPGISKSFATLIPVCDFSDFMRDVLLSFNLYEGQSLDQQTFLLENCVMPQTEDDLEKSYSEIVFDRQEQGTLHNPYDQEQREFDSIERGDVEQLRRSLSEDYTGKIGTLAKDPLRDMKNRGVVIIALASRAAMRGGLLPELAYSLSDSYIQGIENCTDTATIVHLFHSAEYRYAQLVHESNQAKDKFAKRKENPYTEKCKNYIFAHLHDKISIQEMAKELNVNANYLSDVFRKYENISLTAYISREKIKLAQNLLVYSSYSYSEIATYLGYSSQSHLGKQFKKEAGMTLRQYRLKYGVKEFI